MLCQKGLTMKYVYPAIFTEEKKGGYSIAFPDIDGCFTCGKDLADGIAMAEDALALMLVHIEDKKETIPTPSERTSISLDTNQFISYICCDTIQYRRLLNNRAVKKTLSIPEWLNESATAAGLNFSQTLQEALMQKLGVS